MHDNFIRASFDIAWFLLANAAFIGALVYYRRRKGKIFIKIHPATERRLLRDNFVKLCFIFSAFYFVLAISYQHRVLGCENLNEDAQCQCYSLEVMERDNIKEKIHWARNGRKMCPKSGFFQTFLKEHSLK